MSIELMTAVWKIPLPPSEKLVLLALADASNDEGYCWPAVRSLYRKCSLSERTVRDCIGKLVGAGHLTVRERAGRSNYYLVHPGGAPLQDLHPCKSDTPAGFAPHPCNPRTPPLQDLHPTPANAAPITIIEPSREPSENRHVGSSRAARRQTAKRLGEDFELTDDRRAVASAEGVDANREFARFTDHWRAASGANARKHDWDAAWRNWCRKAADTKAPTLTRGGQQITQRQLEAEGLQKLRDRREAIGLKDFRDPETGETAAQYRQAQDAEYSRLQVERERSRAAGAVRDLAAAKRLS